MLKTFKVNITTAHFPTLISKAARSVAIPDPADGVNTLTSTYVGRTAGMNMNTPAIIAMENVIPTIEGLSSFGYMDAPSEGVNILTSKGCKFVATNDKGKFKPISTSLSSPATTMALVQGTYFAFNPIVGLWNLYTDTSIPMEGFSSASYIQGIVECNNHLVAYDHNTIYTSSMENITSFVPDLGTGAGSAIPQELTGTIIICMPVSNGFIIFTSKEAILAKFREPGILVFSLLVGVGGIAFPHNVSQYDTSGVIYAYTQNGLVVIDGEKVSSVFPEITEFLQLGYEEIYDSPIAIRNDESRWLSESQTYPVTTDLVSLAKGIFNVGIFVLNNRHVYVSYGNMNHGGVFTNAFVYDSVLGRWGKLKIVHVAISCPFDTPVFVSNLRDECYYGRFDYKSYAMLLIGKIGLQRDKLVTLQEVEMEYGLPINDHYLGVYQTLDGKNIIERTQLAAMLDSNHYRKWHTRKSGKNLILRLDGTFYLSAVQVTLSTGGFR